MSYEYREKRKNFALLFMIIFYLSLNLFFCPFEIGGQVNEEDSLYIVALGAYKNGFLDIAIDQFQEFLRLYPESPKAPFAWFRLGEAHRVQNKTAIAEVAYQKVIDLYPGSDLAHISLFRLSELRFKKGDYKAALLGYQRLIRESPSTDLAKESQFWLAESLYQLKKHTEALPAYRKFINDSPDHKLIPQALFGAGWCLAELGKYKEAAMEFKKTLGSNPPGDLIPQIHLKLGDVLFELKDFKGSVSNYSEFAKLRPGERHQVVLRQGYALSRVGREGEAAGIFQGYLKTAPKDNTITPEVLFRLGIIFYKQDRFDEALIPLGRFRSEYPRHILIPDALYFMADSYLKLKKEQEAESLLKTLIEGFPKDERAYQACLLMGNIKYQTDNIEEAAAYYSKAASSKDSNITAEARYRLAESSLLMGEMEKALLEFNALDKSYPRNLIWVQMGIFRLGNIYEQKGDNELALMMYSNIVKVKEGAKDIVLAARKRIEELSKGKKEIHQKE